MGGPVAKEDKQGDFLLFSSSLFLDVLEAMKPWRPLVQPAADAFLNRLYDVAETLHRAVYFIFLKVWVVCDVHETCMRCACDVHVMCM